MIIKGTSISPANYTEVHRIIINVSQLNKGFRTLTPSASADEVVQTLLDEVARFSGTARQHDDMTLVAVRVS